MKIIKPTPVGIGIRPYRINGGERLGIAMPVMTTLDEAPRIVGEQALWQLAAEVLGAVPLDAGFAKPHAEFLVAGGAFAAHCDAYRTSRIGIEFAGCAKHLAVVFPDAVDSAPVALEDFMPVPADAPARRPLYGEWDQASATADPFGFPPGFDRAWFNVAPAGQQRHDLAALPDASPYRIAGMHPVHAQQQGTLLPLRGRCFVVRHGSPVLEPVLMRLTTVWFMPGRERAVLIFHGETPIAQFDASDIACLMLAAETPSESRSIEHYAKVHELRTDPRTAALHALRDGDLMPENVNTTSALCDPAPPTPAWQQAMQRHGKRLEREARARAQAQRRAHGGASTAACIATPGNAASPDLAAPLPRLSELAAYVAKQQEFAEGAKAALEAHAAAARERAAAQTSPPPGVGAARRGPPQIQRLRDAISKTRSAVPVEPQDAQEKLLALYRQSAQHQEAAPYATQEASRTARHRVSEKHSSGASLAGEDLTGVDLSGLDLRGADLRNALMESANLTDTDLSDAKLEGAVLARAILRRTRLAHADLREVNLSLAACDGASFTGATLDGATCEKTVFHHCDFEESHLERTDLRECEWTLARFARASLRNLIVTGQNLSGADFSGATIRKMTLIHCLLKAVSFRGADNEGFGVLETDARSTRFDSATIRKACFVKDSQLAAANFTGATLTEVNFRMVNAPSINMAGIRTAQCDFSDADLTGANLRGAHLAGAMMTRTDLTDADLSNSDLIGAMLRGATLARTRLAGANLFRATLSQAHLEDVVGLDDAYTVQTTWSPRAGATS